MLPTETFFVMRCPVCGRTLQTPVELWGKSAACSHCHGTFVAIDTAAEESDLRNNQLTARGSNASREPRSL